MQSMQSMQSIEPIVKFVTTAALTYSAHYGIAKMYNMICVPDGLMGYIYGVVSMGSPLCQVGLQAMTNTQVSYSSMIMTGITRLLVDYIMPTAAPAAAAAAAKEL
jgi:hypothetical protein